MPGLIGEFGASGQTWLAGGVAEQHLDRRQDSNQDNQALTKYRKNKRDLHYSSMDHPRVTKGPAPCHHGEILRHSALTIQLFALAPTTCAAIPGIRATGILALPSGYLYGGSWLCQGTRLMTKSTRGREGLREVLRVRSRGRPPTLEQCLLARMNYCGPEPAVR